MTHHLLCQNLLLFSKLTWNVIFPLTRLHCHVLWETLDQSVQLYFNHSPPDLRRLPPHPQQLQCSGGVSEEKISVRGDEWSWILVSWSLHQHWLSPLLWRPPDHPQLCGKCWSIMMSPGYQISNSASSSKFHHMALLVALVSCSPNFHHLLALLEALVLL